MDKNSVISTHDENQDDWNQFWLGNSVTSFADRFANGYEGEIKKFWIDHLTGAKSATKVIDVACGNGAICWICDEVLNADQKCTEIIGIDFADIHPFSSKGHSQTIHPNISFIPNNPIEKLPFQNNQVDVAVSQWGIEYSDFNASVKELSRVLKTNSSIILVCHTEQSSIVKVSAETVPLLKLIVSSGIHKKFLQLNSVISVLGNKKINLQTSQYATAFNNVQQCVIGLMDEFQNVASPASWHANEIVILLSQTMNSYIKQEISAKKAIVSHQDELQKSIMRLEKLLAASLTNSRLQQLEQAMILEGFAITEAKPIIQTMGEGKAKDMGNIGIGIVATRTPA